MTDRSVRYVAATTLFLVATGIVAVVFFGLSGDQAAGPPEVRDARLELTLFASAPHIMTPIGIAVDDEDQVFVLESHTHLEPDPYDGPEGDRIKVFRDVEGDGRPEDVSIFAEGFEDGMNIAFSPGDVLYLVSSRAVWALYDRDDDGVSEAREKVLEMVRPGWVYDHAGLMGLTFAHDGWMYVSRGNTGSQHWEMVGSDGSSVSGYGDGGNVMRARPDGSELQEVATGFWNPFDLKFDVKGRLLVPDNDPDSRGPNRLVHVIRGGDYGYKSLYGGSGLHPYLAWNGELPGTLPYVAPLGEAPSGMFVADRAALPTDYRGDVLCTIWEENSIVRVDLTPRGVSVAGTSEVLVQGSQRFRPVAMAADSRGHLYITDWMIRQYPNHGHGRIWRLSTRDDVETLDPHAPHNPPQPDPAGEILDEIYAADEPGEFPRLKEALTADDPFVRTAAITALARPVFHDRVVQATGDPDPEVRLGALLALCRAGFEGAEPIARRLLDDPDPRVRRMALVWIGRKTMTALRSDLDKMLTVESVSPALFETYLATVRHLQPEFVEGYRNRTADHADQLPRELPSGFIESIVTDASEPAVVRATTLSHLDRPAEHVDLLARLARAGDASPLRLEAIRSLAEANRPEAGDVLLGIAADRDNPDELRAEALLALAHQPVDAGEKVIELLDSASGAVRVEAARYLRTRSLGEAAEEKVRRTFEVLREESGHRALREQLALVLFPPGSEERGEHVPDRPTTDAAWQEVLTEGGDPVAGRRVFYSMPAQCARCHTVGNRGGYFGPDLTQVGRSKRRRQLIQAILQPAENIAPGWQRWFVKTADGRTHYGRQIDVQSNDTVELYTQSQKFITFEDVASYGMAEGSLMPDGLEAQLTVSDFRDLIAFLEEER